MQGIKTRPLHLSDLLNFIISLQNAIHLLNRTTKLQQESTFLLKEVFNEIHNPYFELYQFTDA